MDGRERRKERYSAWLRCLMSFASLSDVDAEDDVASVCSEDSVSFKRKLLSCAAGDAEDVAMLLCDDDALLLLLLFVRNRKCVVKGDCCVAAVDDAVAVV